MAKIRCSVSYRRISFNTIAGFAISVRNGIFNNAIAFVTPPITLAVFQAIIQTYIDARNAYTEGGTAQKAAFMTAYDKLIDTLDQLSFYVDGLANGSEVLIILSGFKPTKGSATAKPAATIPTGVRLYQGTTGVLHAECDNQPDVDTYLCLLIAGMALPESVSINQFGQIIFPNDGTPPTGGTTGVPTFGPPAIMDLNKNRKKEFTGLVPGVKYYVVFVAINSSGVSPLSAVVSLLCV